MKAARHHCANTPAKLLAAVIVVWLGSQTAAAYCTDSVEEWGIREDGVGPVNRTLQDMRLEEVHQRHDTALSCGLSSKLCRALITKSDAWQLALCLVDAPATTEHATSAQMGSSDLPP